MNENKLEKFSSNIIKWYPFKEKKSIIQIGLNKFITKELEKQFKNVKVVENIDELNLHIKYNYILIYGYENYGDIIENVSSFLEENGKILIIEENKLGINNWSKYDEKKKMEF